MKTAAKTYSGTFTLPLPDARSDRSERRRCGRDEGQRDHLQPRQERLREHPPADRCGAEQRVRSHVRLRPASASSTPRARARSAAVRSTSTSARRRPSCRWAPASRCGSSSCAGTSTAGTTTARPRCGTSPAGVDANGKIIAFDATSFGPSSYAKTPTESMVGQAMTTPGNGPADTTYSGTQYNIPNRRIIGKTVQTLNNTFKVSTLRAPNAMQTCFASEQVIDQLAYLAGKDPYQFRLDNISTAVIAGGLGQWRDTLIGVAQGGQLDAARRELDQADRRHPHRSRHRARRLRRLAVWRRGGDRGEHEVRQDRREAHVRLAGRRSDRRPGSGREPDVRLADHGREPVTARRRSSSTRGVSRASTG